ncbi:hypothetical protein [Methylocaldum sp.]|uniref:hypothetical protein n=1 Tax=Methylocaldum sp. TaxID=1969727 RepID=UPI002D681295|nr:hypothetical protein [Methylocaldum sp.]HYE35384.1 hypothetical protein [Methylocaldum sp.]
MKSRIELAVELMHGADDWAEKSYELRQAARLILSEMDALELEAVARRLADRGWTVSWLRVLIHGPEALQRDRRR